MNTQEPLKVEFHPEAAIRFNELAREILNRVESFGRVVPPPNRTTEIHPVVNLGATDIIGEIIVHRSLVNRLGEETGRCWESRGLVVGWDGEKFEEITGLARKFAAA